jgi:hypothetical protein
MEAEEEVAERDDLLAGVVASIFYRAATLTLPPCYLFCERRLGGVSQWQPRPLGYMSPLG